MYNLKHAPIDHQLGKEFSEEQRDWLTFFKNAHNMTEKDVIRQIKTPAVLEAFERAKICNMPEKVFKAYQKNKAHYATYSIHLGTVADKVRAEKTAKEAEKMIEQVSLLFDRIYYQYV